MKNRMRIISIISALVVSLLFIYFLSVGFLNNANKNQAENIAKNFTKYLITGDLEEAKNLSTGTVKYNLNTNLPQNNKYEYIGTDTKTEIANDNFSIIHVEATYKDSDILNMVFYKMYLIKNTDTYLVYKIEEENPVLEKRHLDNSNPEIFNSVFQSYLTGIEKLNFKAAGEVLIGKAKKAHDSTSQYLQKTQLIQNIADLKGEIIYSHDKQVIVNFSYTNNNREISTLVYFYNTIEGWRIYDISQL